MSYLQLADNGTTEKVMDNYIFVPAGFDGAMQDSYVREDVFDDLEPQAFAEMMLALEPYQSEMLSGYFDKESIAARRKARAERRAARRKARAERVKARRDRRDKRTAARREYRLKRQKARIDSGGGLGNIVNQITGTARSIFGRGGGNVQAMPQTGNFPAQQTRGGGVEFDASIGYGKDDEESFFKKYQTPLIVGGVAVAGLVTYLALKKK
tara:strand:- start:9 stop:641 length:633 start_codon:yes stop_codon:yes gene_type:complete